MKQSKKLSPFFIAFQGRSGSTHLLHLLNQHPDMQCLNELYHPDSFWRARGKTARNRLARFVKNIMGRTRLINFYYNKAYKKPAHQAHGFQFKFAEHFEVFPEVYERLTNHTPNMKCIFLYRENKLRGALSLQNFKRVKRKHKGAANIQKTKSLDLEPLNVDLEWAVEETRLRETRDQNYLEKVSKDFTVLEVSYESLVKSELETLNRIFTFLDIDTVSDPSFFKHKTKRISAERIQEYVSNYDDLRVRLDKENLAHYLEMD